MDYTTIAKKHNEGKIANIICIENDDFSDIQIRDKCFLLIVLIDGMLIFERNGASVNATAPCFICFDEKENPKFISKSRAQYYAIYFHPDFLNMNMTFDFIRNIGYEDIAGAHDLFLLKPFLNNSFIVPISEIFVEKIENACQLMNEELTVQRDWYWSCRGRSYFMEIIIALERMYGLIGYGKHDKTPDLSPSLKNKKLRNAILYIEGHYMEDISLTDISKAGNINHTTLTKMIKAETGLTVSRYLYDYRVKMAKKQLEFTSVPIKDIATRTGFKTVQHFNRTFTKIIGQPPAEFRSTAVQKRKDEIVSPSLPKI